MTETEFIKEMLDNYNKIDTPASIKDWLYNMKSYNLNSLISMMNGEDMQSDKIFRFMIARELQNRFPEEEDRLKLILLVGNYLLE